MTMSHARRYYFLLANTRGVNLTAALVRAGPVTTCNLCSPPLSVDLNTPYLLRWLAFDLLERRVDLFAVITNPVKRIRLYK